MERDDKTPPSSTSSEEDLRHPQADRRAPDYPPASHEDPPESVAELRRKLDECTAQLQRLGHEMEGMRARVEEKDAASNCAEDEVASERPRLHADSPVMVVTVDSDGTILAINAACAGHLGYRAEELRGKRVLEIYHEEDRAAVLQQLQRCLTNPHDVQRHQFRKVRKDGTLVWVEESAQAVRDLRGTEGVQIFCHDVTEERLAAEAREQLLVQLHAVLESITEGVVISDLYGNVLTMNAAALAIHGFSGVDEVRRRIDQFGELFELTGMDGTVVPLSEWPLARAMRGERFTDFEVYLLRKDTGKTFVASYSGTPVRTADGKLILSLVTLRDVTARKRAEDALRLSERKFAAIFHAAPALLVISTLHEGAVLDVNATTLQTLGYRREEIVGRTVFEINLWEAPQERSRVLSALEVSGSLQNLEVRLRKKDGCAMTGLLSAETIDLNGERCLIILVKDITERKRFEEEVARLNGALAARASELETTNRDLEAFSYTVAHDLRRPLNVINGYCQTIQDACGSSLDASCREYLDEVYQGTLRMNQLINALLNFSRLARTEPNRRELDLSAAVRRLARELQRSAERRARFVVAEGMTVNADAALMQIVLENLMGNAWKFTARREEAVIEVGTERRDGETVYFVRDNGTGFDMADAEKLFLPFQRLATPEEFQGSGIGLATVERIIQRHGGRVWGEGRPGEGATFYFTLGAA